MTQKEINICIYSQMCEIAREYFAFIVEQFNGEKEESNWILPANTYTAADRAPPKQFKLKTTI